MHPCLPVFILHLNRATAVAEVRNFEDKLIFLLVVLQAIDALTPTAAVLVACIPALAPSEVTVQVFPFCVRILS